MYNWEKPTEDQIKQLRREQSQHFQHIHWLLHYPLNPADCFAALAFFSLLRGQFTFLIPIITERFRDARIASDRIDSFIQMTTTTMKDHQPSPSNSFSYAPQSA